MAVQKMKVMLRNYHEITRNGCLVDIEVGANDYDPTSIFPQDIANVIVE